MLLSLILSCSVGHRRPNSAQQTPSTALQKTHKFRRAKTLIDKA
jgi:hypothetical protein